eukprot:jgi/Mesvir1/13312/Mv04434-RA.2
MLERRLAHMAARAGHLGTALEHVTCALWALGERVPRENEIRKCASKGGARLNRAKALTGDSTDSPRLLSLLRLPPQKMLHTSSRMGLQRGGGRPPPVAQVAAAELTLASLHDLASFALCQNDALLARHACTRYITVAQVCVARRLALSIELARSSALASVLSEGGSSVAAGFRADAYAAYEAFVDDQGEHQRVGGILRQPGSSISCCADTLYHLGVSCALSGRWGDAEDYADASINVFEDCQDARRLGLCQGLVASVAYYRGDLDVCQGAARDLFCAVSAPPDLAACGLALMLATGNARGRHDEGLDALREFEAREEEGGGAGSLGKARAPRRLLVFVDAVASETKWHLGLQEAAVEEALALSEELAALSACHCLYPLALVAVLEVLVGSCNMDVPRCALKQRARAMDRGFKHLRKLSARMPFVAAYRSYMEGKMCLQRQQWRRARELFHEASRKAGEFGMRCDWCCGG